MKPEIYKRPEVGGTGPIEKEGKKGGTPQIFKWVFFLILIVYVTLSYYHGPILTYLGRYLIVEQPLQRSDLIVCLAGGNIERGLASAEVYRNGFAQKIFIAREELPDGYHLLKEKGITYPESIDLLASLLKGLGVPESALLIGDRPAKSTVGEAMMLREVVKKGGYRSLILVTSPTHSRRAWLTYRKAFMDEKIRIIIHPSHYSGFRPNDWWKKRRYIREVLIEYEKLMYYAVRHFL